MRRSHVPLQLRRRSKGKATNPITGITATAGQGDENIAMGTAVWKGISKGRRMHQHPHPPLLIPLPLHYPHHHNSLSRPCLASTASDLTTATNRRLALRKARKPITPFPNSSKRDVWSIMITFLEPPPLSILMEPCPTGSDGCSCTPTSRTMYDFAPQKSPMPKSISKSTAPMGRWPSCTTRS